MLHSGREQLPPAVACKNGGRSSERESDNSAMKRKAKYSTDLPRLLYTYFNSYQESSGAPSFSKFARSIGVTLSELESFKSNGEFSRAWAECNEIRRDYLIDRALSRQLDSSFTKFILSAEYEMGEKEKDVTDKELSVVLEVVTDEKE